MSFRKCIGGTVIAFVTSLVLAALAAGTADAASAGSPNRTAAVSVASPVAQAFQGDECDVYGTSCKTRTIRSNGIGHYVNYQFCSSTVRSADWQVKDADNGNIVRQGHLGPNSCTSGRVPGLYGAYYSFIFNTAFDAFAVISNA